MSLLPNATFYGPGQPRFIPIDGIAVSTFSISSLTADNITANKITAVSTITGFIEGSYGEMSNFYVDEKLYVNFQELTADSDQLFLNGIPIATTANLSSIQDWSIYAQISTLDGNNQSTIGLSYLEASTIGTRNFTASNIFTQNLMAFNIVNFTSTVVEVYESTIQSDVKLANISTANINNLYVSSGNFSTLNSIYGAFNNISAGTTTVNTITGNSASFSNFTASSITVSSIVSPPVASGSFSSITVVSNTNTGSLTVGSNDVTSFNSAPVFSNGANFYGTRPNFTTGINATGANNFNNCNLDNCGQINAGALNLLGSATIGLTANAGGSILTNNSINLATSNGGSSVINIEAKRNALLAYPIPLSQVNIVAEGNCPNIPVVPLTPYGGEVNIQAYQGPDPIFPLTPVTNAFAPGAIKLIAYSKGVFPGLIIESAGSILAYSGLTTPATGLYGASFYSALTCLSLTAGLSPALTSFPGTVYLRGDNGTKVLNGLYIDHLYPASGYTLAISGAGGSNVTIDDCAYIGMTTNPVLDGGNVNGQIRNFSTISGVSLLVSNISTGTTSVDQIYTRNININPQSTVYISHPDLTINANITTDEAEDPQYNNLNLYASSNINIQSFATSGGGGNINIQCANNPALYSINITGDTYVSRTLTANLGLSTTNINLSTINGAPYVPGGGGGGGGSTISTFTSLTTSAFFVSSINGATFTNTLDMNNNNISSVSTTISFQGGGFIKDYDVGIHLFDIDGAGSAQTRLKNGSADVVLLPAGDIYFAGVLHSQNNLDMLDHNITAVSSISAGGELSITANTNILTTATSTINTVSETYFTGGITRFLISNSIPQPVIQYGQVSSSGSSGSVVVTMPQRYTSVSSYLPFAVMADYPASEIYVSTLTRATFEIGWQNGGGGNQLFNWHTMGT